MRVELYVERSVIGCGRFCIDGLMLESGFCFNNRFVRSFVSFLTYDFLKSVVIGSFSAYFD